MKIKEFTSGSVGTTEGIITKIEEKTTRTNTLYVSFNLMDGESQVTIKKWNETLETFNFNEGQVVFVEMKAEDYNGTLNYIAKSITASSAEVKDFVVGVPVDSERMFAFLYKNAERCQVYAPVVQDILNDNKERLLRWGAGKMVHHNVYGGLLYHMFRMTKTAAYIASVYNNAASMLPGCRDVSPELLIAGTILHDIGKLWELDTTELGSSEYTVVGTLMGHAYIGAEVVGRYCRKHKLDNESTMLLQHLILSHHGRYEYQAVAIPSIPEAMILHHIDMIDSKMYQFEVEADKIEPGTMSGKVFGLEQSVYRPTWRKAEQPEKTEN